MNLRSVRCFIQPAADLCCVVLCYACLQGQRVEGLELHLELLRREAVDGEAAHGGSDGPSRVLHSEIKSLKGRLKASAMALAVKTAEADRCEH